MCVCVCVYGFLRVRLFQPVVMLFVSINESTIKYILLSNSMKLNFTYIYAFFNLSKLISLDSFSETIVFLSVIFSYVIAYSFIIQ